jgi:hypothetical protein
MKNTHLNENQDNDKIIRSFRFLMKISQFQNTSEHDDKATYSGKTLAAIAILSL